MYCPLCGDELDFDLCDYCGMTVEDIIAELEEEEMLDYDPTDDDYDYPAAAALPVRETYFSCEACSACGGECTHYSE